MNEKDRREWARAASEGRKRFKMSEPCANGHLSERYTFGNASCVMCQKEYYARKRNRNRVVIDLVDPAHVELLRQYAQSLNDFARGQKS